MFGDLNVKIACVESKVPESRYSSEYALGLLATELKASIDDYEKFAASSRASSSDPKTQESWNDLFNKLRAAEIVQLPDAGRYYVFQIPDGRMNLLFNKETGAIYNRTYYYNDGISPGTSSLSRMPDVIRNGMSERMNDANIWGLSVLPSKQIRHPDGTLENASNGFTGLFINGSIIKNANVVIDNGRCLVPLRLISENLGAQVSWDAKTRGISIKDGERLISLEIGSSKLDIDGKETSMDVTPQIINDYTYVPIRFIAESMGCDVEWSQGGAEGPYYLLGIPHVMVSRYSEGPNFGESAAVQFAKTSLWEGIASEYPTVGDERTRLVDAIESLKAESGNDRFFFLPTDEGVSLWVDKYTSTVLVCDSKQGQKITLYNPKGKGAVLSVFGD
jgi:hypothetical protein